MGGLLLLARDAPSSLEQSAQRLIKSTLLVFEREASSEASSSSRGGPVSTGRALLEKPDQPGIESAVPRGALWCFSRARRASSRPDSSKHCAQRTQTRRARVLRSQAPYLDQGQEGASRSAAAAAHVAVMVKQRRRSAAAVGFQNIEVVPSEALESALRERQQLCKHGEAWARRIGASDDPQKLKAFTGLWWDLSPQMRSWEVPPDDGSKCQKCKRTHRLGFYRGITYRDRCECNKGGRKIADEWKLLGYECYKRGLRERELVGTSTTVVQRKKSQSPRPRAPSGPLPDVDLGACAGYVKGGAASASETRKDAAVASTAYHRSPSAQATPTTPRRPRRPRRRRRRPKPRRRPRRSNYRRPAN